MIENSSLASASSGAPIGAKHDMPPLILHPFADSGGPDKLVESSRAGLMLQGLLPVGEQSREDLEITLLDGRFCEIRMLFYVGKDLARWIDQCIEYVNRNPDLNQLGIRSQSFAALLVQDSPPSVQDKLRKWGVADYKSIFTRALGLNAIFANAPHRKDLSNEFVRHYYRFADQLFACSQSQGQFTDIAGRGFVFEIYASGEYTRMLERQWQES